VNAYLLITPSGGHTELRQVGTSNTYEAADSSYLQLIDGGNGSLILTSIDGTQLSYNLYNGQYQCGQIKDRNGNFISVSYYSDGRINTVTDTLARIITFNYDAYLNLSSITQDWGGVTHPWVNFGWGTVTMQTSFTNMTVVGPQNGAIIPVITQVSFSDGSRSNFNYTAWGQVYQIASYGADSVLRNWTGYNLPGSEWLATSVQSDCPRFTEQKEWAGAWNNNQVVSTSYSMAGDHSSGQVTMPDGTIYKELFATIANWQKGLTTGTEYWSANVKKKWTATSYTQDDTNLNYQKNPRPTESNIYDAEGNHKRTGISYTTFTLPSSTSCSLPADVYEYNSDAATLLRRTHTDYRYDSAYLTRRIIGLVDGVSVYDGAYNLASKVRYDYDWPQYSDLLQDTPTTATQHDDVNYSRSFCYGRANKVWEMRYDVTDPNNTNVGTDSIYEYYTTGSVIYARDPSGHAVTISYTDSFSDTAKNSLNTFAYPTTITDPDGFASTTQYNYDFGAATRTQRPAPAGQTQGAIQTFEYDSAGRTTRVNQVNNGGYQRWVYDASGPVSTFSLLQTGGVEAWAVTLYDGVGRVRASGGDNPNSTGGYRAQFTLYDVMGRATDTTNPSEINGSWVPAGDDAAGWAWTHQAYDWKGRPTLTTNPDGTTKEAAYGGCGCAGGAVVTVRDELGRQQRVTSDILGRTWKTEVLDWYPSQTVYSTTTNTYNVRDQVTSVYQQAGSGGTGQTTSLTYDGHGRLKTQQSPSQTAATTYAYNRDDTVLNVTDGRGAITNLTYNNRHQATNISYSAPTGITPSTAVSFAYDSAGNRTSMTDGSGSVTYAYDQLSRLTSEGRTFAGPFSSTIYTLSYGYNLAGGLTSVTDPTGAVINYAYDQTGRTTGVTGSSFGGVTSYASNMQYRAWGAVKNLSTGDGKTTGVSYNSKLQPTDFSVGTSNSGVISKHYDYNSDGRLHYSQDQLDNRFDRSYTYDYMGRVTEAFSGPMARGLADTTNRPYKQYYQYDAMGHLTGRVGSRLWGGPGGAFGTDTYLNNRNTQWQYDADGRLTSDMQTQYTFDAAGRVIFVDTDGSNQTLSYDGDGVKTKIVGTDMSTNVVTTIYQVTSSVLGSVVTELDQSGQKTRGFVYSNGEMVAWQQKSGSTESVLWKHSDQNNASYRMAGSGGVVDTTESRELDPLNSDAGTRSPYTFPSSHPQGEVMSAPGFADAVNSNCRIDGVPAPCSMANNMLRSGAGYKAPSHSVTGVYSISERRYVGLAIWGFNPSTGQTGYWAHGTTSVIVHIDGYPDSPGKQIPWTDFVPVNTDTFSDHSPQQTGQSNESACARLAGSLVHYVIRYLSDVSEPDHASAQLGGFMAQLAINTYGKGHDDPNLKTDGFKDALVKDGQGGDVYKHIYGHAGMTLLGNRYLFLGFSVRGGKTGDEIREAQLAQDIDQRDHPNKYPGHSALEAATEVRDDIAARAVGEFMRDRFSSKINNTELRQNIFDTLCDH
jgi:YD repeat-containing protein